jgi:hypothetical protein
MKKLKNREKGEKSVLHTAGCVDVVPLTPSGIGRVSVCASAELHVPPPNEDHEDSAEDEDEEDEESSPMLTSISKAA